MLFVKNLKLNKMTIKLINYDSKLVVDKLMAFVSLLLEFIRSRIFFDTFKTQLLYS